MDPRIRGDDDEGRATGLLPQPARSRVQRVERRCADIAARRNRIAATPFTTVPAAFSRFGIAMPSTAPKQRATRRRTLFTATPLWAESAGISVRTRRRPTGAHYDVVIVGAGISGALMAHALADGKRRILVVDRRKPVGGSSLASTAMIMHEIDTPLHRLVATLGAAKARRAWQRSARAVEALLALDPALVRRCGLKAKATLYLAGDAYGSRALDREARQRAAAGLAAAYLDGSALKARFDIDRTAAILSTPSASADPAQLTAALLRRAASLGAELAAPVEIADVASVGGSVVLATRDGVLLVADHAVFCTGYEFPEAVASRAHSVVSTWAIASRPHRRWPAWLADTQVWEGSDPYLYFRTTDDGRLIAGGEDESDLAAHRDIGKLRRKARIIAGKISDLLSVDFGEPAFAWGAPFGTTTTGLPFIDTVPALPRVHAVMGFGGNGITFSQIAAEIVRARIEGGEDPDADLFRLPG
jgi:glycine/D-amino acid oxidase-like deaminating enzyme